MDGNNDDSLAHITISISIMMLERGRDKHFSLCIRCYGLKMDDDNDSSLPHIAISIFNARKVNIFWLAPRHNGTEINTLAFAYAVIG